MIIRLTYVGYLQIIGYKNDSDVELPDGITISEFLSICQIQPQHWKMIIPMVNEKVVSLSERLHDGDALYLHLAIGGG